MLLTFHSRTLSRKRNTLWTLFLTVAILLVLQFYFERAMAETQDINADIPFMDEDRYDGYVLVKRPEASAEPLNKAGFKINSEIKEKCFESATTEVDKNKNREWNQNTAGCMQNDNSPQTASGGFEEEIKNKSKDKKISDDKRKESDEDCDKEVGPCDVKVMIQSTYGDKGQDTVNKNHKDHKDGNTSEKMETEMNQSVEKISQHTEVQAYSSEKKYDSDSYDQNKQEQNEDQAKHKKSSLKRKSATGDDSPVQESKEPAADYDFANGENTQSTEIACSSGHKVNAEEKNVAYSSEANKPIKHQQNPSAKDHDKSEKEEINPVESEQDGRLGRTYIDKGCNVDTGKHEKECKESSKQEARNKLQMLEQKNNAAEGSDGDVKNKQDAVSLKTTGMHKKCFSSSKQEKESKAKKYTYHSDEPSKSGNWNREKVHEQDEPDVYPYYKAMEKAMEKYVYFWKRRDIYSQWHKSKFYVNGQKFTCAEQYMMYKKAELFEDFKLRSRILKTDDPRKMKALGRKVSNFDERLWRSQCLYVVKEGNKEKFSQNKEMEKELFDTHPKILVEASPYDQIWGIGLDVESPGAYDESKWEGLNLLGFILTEVRDELMFKAGRIEENQKKVYLEALKTKYCEPLEQNLEYFSSVGDDKTEEREEASRSKPESDVIHKMNNDNNGETKISEAEPTKKEIGTWENKPGSDCKHNKNKNIKNDASQKFKAEPTDNISKRYLEPENDDEKRHNYFDGNTKPPTRVFPGIAVRQETPENWNEAKEVREMSDVQGRQQQNKQSSQMTTKTIGRRTFNNRNAENPESLEKGQLSKSFPGVKSGGKVCLDPKEFPPLTHDVNKTEFQRKIRKKKKNDDEVKENREEKESKISKHVVDINERSEEVTHVDHTGKEVFDQFDDEMDGMESFVHVKGTEEMQQFEKQDENAKPAEKCDIKKREGFNTDSKKMVKEEKEKSHDIDAEGSCCDEQTEMASASGDEQSKTLLAVFQFQGTSLVHSPADPTKESVSEEHRAVSESLLPEEVKGLHNCRTLIEERKSKDSVEVKTNSPGKFTKKSHSAGHPPSPTKLKPIYKGQSYHKKSDKESDIF